MSTFFRARTSDGTLVWERGKALRGDPAVLAGVTDALAAPGQVSVTPTGPTVDRDPSDPLAVLAALFARYGGEVDLDGDIPDLTFGAPPTAVF